MRYFVIAPTGERYGPADVNTLNQWAADNRLFPNSIVEEEGSGLRMAASGVPGINFAPKPVQPITPPAPGQPYGSPNPAPGPVQPATPYQAGSSYNQPGAPYSGGPYQQPGPAGPVQPGQAYQPVRSNAGNNDLLLSFGMAVLSPVLSIFCIYGFTTALVGIAAAWRALQNGQKIAILSLVLNIAALVFWVVIRFVIRYHYY